MKDSSLPPYFFCLKEVNNMNESVNEVLDTFIHLLDRELSSKYLLVSILSNNDEAYKDIITRLISLYLKSNIHTLFLPKTIVNLSEEIHSNLVLRDFMVEVIDKLNILLGVEKMQMFCDTIQNNLETLHSGDDTNYAGPRQFVLGIYFDPSTMSQEALMKNHWLIFILLLILTFDKSTHYSGYHSEEK